MLLHFLCLCLAAVNVVRSSRGDRSLPYQRCIATCIQQYRCNPDFGDSSWATSLCARCRYNCLWEAVSYFQQNNEEIPQFHGKWPFIAIDLPTLGIFVQEPASVIFSFANLVGMCVMLNRIQRADLHYDKTMWYFYSIIGIITWISSLSFHWIDIRITEYLDYFSAFGLIVYAMYASVHNVFPELIFTNHGKSFSKLLAVICLGFYGNHTLQMLMDAYEINEKTHDLPYGAEYAKSARSTCKKCHGYIGQHSLRMSAREPSKFYDGIQDNWFHLDCFFSKLGKGDHINERSIRGMDNLRWDDQENIRNRIKDMIHSNSKTSTSSYSAFKIEYSKTNRGKCHKCKENFEVQYIKIGFKSVWYHRQCVITEENYEGSIADAVGFDKLKEEDRGVLIQEFQNNEPKVEPMASTADQIDEIASTSSDENTAKEKDESDDDMELPVAKKFCFTRPSINSSDALKEKLKKQSEIMWETREKLQQNKLPRNTVIALLESNSQMNDAMRQKTEDQLLEHLVDCITFGKPTKCEKCPNGLFVYSLSMRSYACIGYMSGYTRCINVNANPPRTPFSVPVKVLEKTPFLRTLRYNSLSTRVYSAEDQKIIPRRESNYFKNLGSRGATEAFIEGIKHGLDEKGHCKKIIKFGTAVDSEFEHAASVHVFRDADGTLYSTTLHQTDVAMNINSYYKMQLLKHDTIERYWVFRSWGRVGTNVGGVKQDYFNTPEKAIHSFEEVFREKSGNDWKNRKYFLKKPGFFMLVETDYSELEKADIQSAVPGSLTTLHRSIKEIILMISDLGNINESLNELQLDTTRMPLGKLSKQQITNAFSVLTEVQTLIKCNGSHADIVDATNRFYTLVPHDFGMKNADILDNLDIIKKKCEMLDSLMDFQFAYNFIKQGETVSLNRDPVDIHYEKLRCDMEYVDPKSSDFKLIQTYLKNSHGETHSDYNLEIIDVIKLDRSGEDAKFLKNIGNRKLLWHGSRVGNFVGILSQGLRIAPPEAPATGYMFGKGVYFADMVSKSANYCNVPRCGEGLLLLCDVALGKSQEEHQAKNIHEPKIGFNSVKGVGRIRPNEILHYHPEGYTIALNGVTTDNTNTNDYALVYNEYIVYNVDQIKLKYLLRCRFKHC